LPICGFAEGESQVPKIEGRRMRLSGVPDFISNPSLSTLAIFRFLGAIVLGCRLEVKGSMTSRQNLKKLTFATGNESQIFELEALLSPF
jgi:hypothetical protein